MSHRKPFYQNLCLPIVCSVNHSSLELKEILHTYVAYTSLRPPRTGANTLHILMQMYVPAPSADDLHRGNNRGIRCLNRSWQMVGSGVASAHGLITLFRPRRRVPNNYSGQSHSSRHFLCQDLRHSFSTGGLWLSLDESHPRLFGH